MDGTTVSKGATQGAPLLTGETKEFGLVQGEKGSAVCPQGALTPIFFTHRVGTSWFMTHERLKSLLQ